MDVVSLSPVPVASLLWRREGCAWRLSVISKLTFKVIVGESRTFAGGPDFMRSHGIEVIDLDLDECVQMMEDFIAARPELWFEDIGELQT